MISELNIETTVELVSVQTFYKGTQPIYYQRNGNNTYALLVSNCSRVSFCTNNVDKMLDKQSVFLCLPGEILSLDKSAPLESDVFLILFKYYPPDNRGRKLKSSVQLPVKATIDYEEFYKLLNALLAETTYDIYNYKPRLNVLLAYLLLVLCRFCKYKELESSPIDTSDIPPYVKIVLDYLESNFQKDISSLSIQGHVGLNYDYVNTIFKRYVGVTIMKYLDSIRINTARELLQHTILPINEIAARVGIMNPQYFTKKFNSLVGIPPIRYRQMRTNSDE